MSTNVSSSRLLGSTWSRSLADMTSSFSLSYETSVTWSSRYGPNSTTTLTKNTTNYCGKSRSSSSSSRPNSKNSSTSRSTRWRCKKRRRMLNLSKIDVTGSYQIRVNNKTRRFRRMPKISTSKSPSKKISVPIGPRSRTSGSTGIGHDSGRCQMRSGPSTRSWPI